MSGAGDTKRPLRIGSRLTGSAALAGGVVAFVLDLTANQLGTLGQWVPWTVVVCGVPSAAVMWYFEHRPSVVPEVVERRSLTDRGPLVGRDNVIAEAVRKARADQCVLVRGPRGIGTSSVAIEALLRLVPAPGQRHRVDAYGQDEREVRVSVLRTLDLPVGQAGNGATELIANRLRNSGEALLIDNVTDPAQVRWIARSIPKSYVIIAGDLESGALRSVPEVQVGRLEAEDGLSLFRDPYGLAPPPEPRRWWPWRRRAQRRPANTIDDRVNAERDLADELAEHYLLHPRIVKEAGRIFDANPNVSISELLRLLRSSTKSDLSVRFREAFRPLLVGVPKEGLRLVALMAQVPPAAYEVAALAALAGWPVTRTEACLTDLDARTLVDRGSKGARLLEQVGTLDLKVGGGRRRRARRRLYSYYAELAGEHADRLGTERYAEARAWFESVDDLLRHLALEAEPMDEIIAIADALEVWYAQEGATPERDAVARRLVNLKTEPATSVGHLRLAAMARTRGDANDAAQHLNLATAHMPARGLPQLRTEAALQSLDRGDLTAARADIEACLAVRPPGDVRGRIGDEINLGVIATRESADASGAEPSRPEEHRAAILERAHYHLIQALDLAEDIGEISGQAHAREMIGVVLAAQQNTQAALREWQAAGTLWARIGDAAGRRRCDLHCASRG